MRRKIHPKQLVAITLAAATLSTATPAIAFADELDQEIATEDTSSYETSDTEESTVVYDSGYDESADMDIDTGNEMAEADAATEISEDSIVDENIDYTDDTTADESAENTETASTDESVNDAEAACAEESAGVTEATSTDENTDGTEAASTDENAENTETTSTDENAENTETASTDENVESAPDSDKAENREAEEKTEATENTETSDDKAEATENAETAENTESQDTKKEDDGFAKDDEDEKAPVNEESEMDEDTAAILNKVKSISKTILNAVLPKLPYGQYINTGMNYLMNYLFPDKPDTTAVDTKKKLDDINAQIKAVSHQIDKNTAQIISTSAITNDTNKFTKVLSKASDYLSSFTVNQGILNAASMIRRACQGSAFSDTEAQKFDQKMLNIFNPNSDDTNPGVSVTTYAQDLLNFGKMITGENEQDATTGNTSNIFDSYHNICKNRYFMNTEGLQTRKSMNQMIMSAYESRYKLLDVSLNYTMEKNRAIKDEAEKNITKLQKIVDETASAQEKKKAQAKIDAYQQVVNEAKANFDSAETAFGVLKDQHDQIGKYYKNSSDQLDSENADYENNKTAICYWLNKGNGGTKLNLNAKIQDANENYRQIDSSLYDSDQYKNYTYKDPVDEAIAKRKAEIDQMSGLKKWACKGLEAITPRSAYEVAVRNNEVNILNHSGEWWYNTRFSKGALGNNKVLNMGLDALGFHRWTAKNIFVNEDKENTSNPFYNCLNEADYKELSDAFQNSINATYKQENTNVFDLLKKFLFVKGNDNKEQILNDTTTAKDYNLYAGGKQTTKFDFGLNKDSANVTRSVRVVDKDGNFKDMDTLSENYNLWVRNKFTKHESNCAELTSHTRKTKHLISIQKVNDSSKNTTTTNS